MKIRDVAVMTEIAASIGVLISLIFVGIQLNEGNRETRAATMQSVVRTEMDMAAIFVEYASTWDKVLVGAPLAAGEERRRAINLYNMGMLESANRYLQYRSEYLDRSSWQGTLKSLSGMKDLPIYDEWRVSLGGQGQHLAFLALLDSL